MLNLDFCFSNYSGNIKLIYFNFGKPSFSSKTSNPQRIEQEKVSNGMYRIDRSIDNRGYKQLNRMRRGFWRPHQI